MRRAGVVFLDIDGVLHIDGCQPGTFDPDCVANLNWLTDTTGADIVVSSTWRHMRHEGGIAAILARQGVTGQVVGKTPDLSCRGKGTVIWTSVTRGSEIRAWLRHHVPRPFVILDDDRDMDDLAPYLVQTSWVGGLTRAYAQQASDILQIPTPPRARPASQKGS